MDGLSFGVLFRCYAGSTASLTGAGRANPPRILSQAATEISRGRPSLKHLQSRWAHWLVLNPVACLPSRWAHWLVLNRQHLPSQVLVDSAAGSCVPSFAPVRHGARSGLKLP